MEITDIVAMIYLETVLLMFAVVDFRKKSLCPYAVGAAMFVMIVYSCIVHNGIVEPLLGLIPGIAVALLSFFSNGGIGIGDAFILGTIGAWCGLLATLSVFFTALLICSITGIILMLFRKATRKTALPFVPFIFAGYTLCEISNLFL